MKLLSVTLVLVTLLIGSNSIAQNWTERAAFGGSSRWGTTCFTIGDFAYVTCGRDSASADQIECWSYRTATDHWQLKASLPVGQQRRLACAFAFGGNGYVCCGEYNLSQKRNDLWQYSPGPNNWAQRQSLPGPPRYGAYSFAVAGIAYVGGGNTTTPQGPFLNDLYAYDPLANSWSVKTGLPAQGRFAATAFTVGDTAYVFGGKRDDLTLTNELWRYIPATDTWTQMTSMPAAARMYAMAWSGTSHGIIAGGESSNITLPEAMFYRPSTDTWGYVPSYPGAGGWAGCAFTVNDTAYAGLGINGIVPHRDLWALESANLTAVPEAAASIGALSVIPDVCAPSSVVRINASDDLLRSITRIELYDLTGRRVLDVPGRLGSSQFHVPRVTDGRYVMSVSLADGSRRGLPLTIVE